MKIKQFLNICEYSNARPQLMKCSRKLKNSVSTFYNRYADSGWLAWLADQVGKEGVKVEDQLNKTSRSAMDTQQLAQYLSQQITLEKKNMLDINLSLQDEGVAVADYEMGKITAYINILNKISRG